MHAGDLLVELEPFDMLEHHAEATAILAQRQAVLEQPLEIVLDHEGYSVVTAASVQEAESVLHRFKEHSKPVTLTG